MLPAGNERLFGGWTARANLRQSPERERQVRMREQYVRMLGNG